MGVAQAWKELGLWARVWGGAPRVEEVEAGLIGKAPQETLGGSQLDPSLATLLLGKQRNLNFFICKIGLIIPTCMMVVSIM